MTDKELRDLDAEIHRRVMGRECRWVPHDGSDNFLGGSVFTADRDYLVNGYLDPKENREIPRYSTDIAAAFSVIERLMLNWAIDHDPAGWGRVRFWVWWGSEDDGVFEVSEYTFETFAGIPLAICKAALAAVGEPKEPTR